MEDSSRIGDQIAMRKALLSFVLLSFLIEPLAADPWQYSGRANSWFLYQTDDVSSTTVAVVKSSATRETLGIAVGRDIAVECAKPGVTCEYRKIGEGTELDLR